jgi:RNA polymerase sigma factor (TIGR02999 family)
MLHAASDGDREAFNRLIPLVYRELSRIARYRLHGEPEDQTLNTTALVHEAYLKLADQDRRQWQSREHFYAVASEAMRRILIDHARRRRSQKRGTGQGTISLDETPEGNINLLTDEQATELLALDVALDRLAEFNPRGASIVQYRFFGGLSTDEIATVMAVSDRTVRRGWTVARAWLREELDDHPGHLMVPGSRL